MKIGPLSWDLPTTGYDDWLVIDRERQHQIRVHAFGTMSAWFVSAERPGDDFVFGWVPALWLLHKFVIPAVGCDPGCRPAPLIAKKL